MRTIFFLFRIFTKYPLLIWSNAVLIILTAIISAASVFSLAPLVDFLLNHEKDSMSPLSKKVMLVIEYFYYPISQRSLIFLFLSLMMFSTVVGIVLRYFMIRLEYAFTRDLIIRTFRDFFSTRWYFFSSTKMGTLLNTFTREMGVVANAFKSMSQMISNIFQATLYLIVPLYISWKITAVSIAFGVLIALGYMQFGKLTYRLGKLNTSTANFFHSVLQEGLSAAKIVLGYGNQNKLVQKLDKAFDAHRKVTIKSQIISSAIPQLYQPGALAIIIAAFYFSKQESLPLPDTSVLLFSLIRILPLIGQISGQKISLDNFLPSYEQINTLKEKAVRFRQPSGNNQFKGIRKELSIENVTYSYPDNKPVLDSINIHVPVGKMIAIVGPSGAGKSTIIDIIMGFNEPNNGLVLIDGKPFQDFNIISYRKRIGYVPQESILFNQSIKDNLLWVKEDASEKEIISACKLANAYEFIKELSEGYDTIVGDRGVNLSGGQIQRIALARAILRKPELLILDEATSSLDTRSERLIQQAIENISKETTVIAIAHRLSSIVNADYVYLIERGRVVEEGTYIELTRMNGKFKRMVELQFMKTA